MSVLNIHFTRDRVDLLSDTLVYSGSKPAGLCTRKVHVSPAGTFAWSTRGLCRLGDTFDTRAIRCATVDDAEVAALAWIEAISDDDLSGTKGIEVTVAGWSARAGDLVVVTLDREMGRMVNSKVYARGVYLLPGSRNMPAMPATVTEAQMIRLALAQWKIRDSLDDTLCIGGIGRIASVSRDGASDRIAFLYPDYAEHAALFGDPAADEVAAFLGAREAAAA